jgi:hypothetical protein
MDRAVAYGAMHAGSIPVGGTLLLNGLGGEAVAGCSLVALWQPATAQTFGRKQMDWGSFIWGVVATIVCGGGVALLIGIFGDNGMFD